MAKIHFGEIALSIHGKPCALRPSFASLYAIEREAGDIAALLRLAETGALPDATLRLILREGLRATGHPLRAPWRKLRLAAYHFLRSGLGYLDQPAASIPAATASAPPPALMAEPLDWHGLYQTATVTLGCTGQEFWRMTLTELRLRTAAHASLHGIDRGADVIPALAAEIAALQARFPDESPASSSGRVGE